MNIQKIDSSLAALLNHKILFVLLSILIFSSSAFTKDIYLKDYLISGKKDVTPFVYEMLKDAKKSKATKIIIDEGEYHFYSEKAFEKYCHVSNHDNTMRKIAFPIIGFEKLEIIGNNARFIFHGPMMPFNIEDSKDIKISGISIDWHIPLHSEGLIVANNEIEKTFDLQISNEYPYVIRNNNLYFIKEGYEHDLGRGVLFDPVRKAVAYNSDKYTALEVFGRNTIQYKEKLEYIFPVDKVSRNFAYQDAEWGITAEEIKPGLVRIKNSKIPPPVGMIFICKGRNGYNRIVNAIHIHKSRNVQLRDMNIYHAGGMGIIGERSENILLENVSVKTNPNGNRLLSTTADATHFVNCKGTVTMKNCVFRNMLDDATNVHGSYMVVDEVLSPNKIGVRVGHYQQAGFIFAQKGDKIGIINPKETIEPFIEAIVKSIEFINERYYTITFKDNITATIAPGHVLENIDWYPELTITGCDVTNNRSRGFLLSTTRKTVIENNYFSNMMSAIQIEADLSFWYESGRARDVVIRNNKFGDCVYGGGKSAVISIRSSTANKNYAFGKIIIDNNEFKHFDSAILDANDVEELHFTNNKISKTTTFTPLFPNLPVLNFNKIKSLTVNGIQYEGDLKAKVKIDKIINPNIIF
jgi:parallel beta-helix repeat protein